MKPRLSLASAVSFAVLLGACANTNQGDSIEIVDFGIYRSNGDVPELLAMTDEIPATVGMVFGIRVLAAGEHTGDYDFRWTFPEMRNPASGQVWTEMTGTREVKSDKPQSFFVRINNAWEAKSGDWTVRLSKDGLVITEKSFNVHDPRPEAD